MKIQNMLFLAFLTLISSTIAADSSGGSMPKSLQSRGTSSAASKTASNSKSESASASASSSKASNTSSSKSSGSKSIPKLTTSASSSASAMPKISSSASAITSGANATSSSYTVTFTPLVPTGSNPEIHIETLPSGTTFIAVGGVLGLVFSVLILARLIMSCMSSRTAKKGNMMQNQQQEFDYDPTLFQEKDLKKHASRASVYSLGSTSTLNVLGSQASMEQLITPSGRSLRTALMNNNSRASMFISPTEMLVNQQLYSRGVVGYEDNGYFSYDSPIESPCTAAHTYTNSTPSLMERSQEPSNDPKKRSRPPSVFMEQLFDDETSMIRTDHDTEEYDSNAHNRV